ncbi:MAG: hypothetical protein ACSLE9_00740 [Burkholderiaceae bacterium]
MTFPATITPTQANKETPIGEMFVDLVWAALGSHDPAGTSGLTFGVNGGPMLVDGVLTTIADQTTLLTASSTCYVEWTRAGVLSGNTTGFTAGSLPLYVVTTSSSGVASMVDWRTWQALPGVTGRLSLSVAGGADVTLSAEQARCEILNFTGALTANINVIAPDGPQRWVVCNNTSGAFTLTVKTAAGTGIAVTQGKAAGVVADGTNVILGNNDIAAVGGALLSANNLSDLASASTARTNLGLGTAAVLAVDTDGTLAANDDARVPSQKAVKTAIAAAVTGLWDVKGGTDCSANPDYPAALKGDAYVVTVAGKIGGASGTSADIGDVFVALLDNAGGTEASVGASWFHIEHNLVGVALLASPAFTGTPTAPTAAPSTNNTQLATTAYADAAAAAAASAGANTVTALSISSGVVNIDCSLGDYFTLALTAHVTSITFSNLPGSGKGASKWVEIVQGAGPYTVAWPASFKWAGGSAGAVSTANAAVDELAITTVNNGTAWKATLGQAFS